MKKILVVDDETDNITFKNVSLSVRKDAPYMFYNSRNCLLDNAAIDEGDGLFMKLVGDKTAGIRLKKIDSSNLTDRIEFGPGTNPQVITWD